MRKITFDNTVISSVFESEEKFEGFRQLMFEAGQNEFSEPHMTKAIANKIIRDKFAELSGLEAGKQYNRTEIRRAIRRMKNDPVAFDLIEEVLDDLLITGWQENPFFAEFVDRRNLRNGDKNLFVTEDDTILTVEKIAGNHHDLDRQRLGVGEAFSVNTAWYGVKVYAEFERIVMGVESWDKLVSKVYEAFDKFVINMMYAAVGQAATKMAAITLFHKTGTLTLANIAELAGNVEAANIGCEVTIMGTKAALTKLYALSEPNWVSDGMKDERNQTGRLGYWNGYRLVEIPNAFTDKTMTAKLVSDSQIMFMPVSAENKFVKFVDEGDGVITEITDEATRVDMTYEFEYQRQMGVAVVIRRNFGVYDNI